MLCYLIHNKLLNINAELERHQFKPPVRNKVNDAENFLDLYCYGLCSHLEQIGFINITAGFLLGIFFKGGAKSVVMQISFFMLLFSNQVSGRGKSFQEGQTASRGAPCPPVEESQTEVSEELSLPMIVYLGYLNPSWKASTEENM